MEIVEKCGRGANVGYGIGLVRSTSFGRKRVALSNLSMEFRSGDDCIATTPLKRRWSQDSFFHGEKSALEELPQEILIRVLCGVEHDDLKRLFFVSKAIREATLIAKQSHFAYSTPKKTMVFQNVECIGDFIEVEAPNAPKQSRVPRNKLSVKNLSEISVALFASGNDEGWVKKDLFVDMEMGN